MATSIFDSLTDSLLPEVFDRAASALGETAESTGKAAQGGLFAILSTLVQSAGNSDLMSHVFGFVRSPANDHSVLQNPASLLGGLTGKRSPMSDLGSSFLGSLFGGRLSGIADAIGSYAGVRGGSARSLLGMLAPLVLGFLGDRVKRDGLDFGSFTRLLAGQQDAIAAATPAPLARALGLGEPTHEAPWPLPRAEPAPVRPRRGVNKLWPVLAALALAAIFLFSRGRPALEPGVTAMDSALNRSAPSGMRAGLGMPTVDWVWDTLPGGFVLNVPPDGIERRLVRFIENRNARVDETTWFDFDRLLFETGSATLRPESQEQLRNVAEILKAFPSVNAKVGGYTDNLGNPPDNLRLSSDRARNVRGELLALGIGEIRLTAEGYGEQHPIGDNTTEEGRAQNRRISLRVTKK